MRGDHVTVSHRISQRNREWPSLTVSIAFLFLLLHFLINTSCAFKKGTFGEICDLNQPCDHLQHLACINNTCRCDSPSNQIFDNSSNKCLSVVGGPCTSESSTPSPNSFASLLPQKKKTCIKNAHCVEVPDENGDIFTECQCLDTFIENSDGDCVPGIGQPCSYLPHECNPLGMIVCKDGTCKCLDELQIFDSDMKRCVSPAGTHCRYDHLQLGCVKNALCFPFFYWMPPKCLCKPGYVQTKSRQCIPEAEYSKNKHNFIEHTSPRTSQVRYDPKDPNESRTIGSNWPLGTILYANHSKIIGFN